MKVTNEKIEDRQAFLTIEMEPAEVAESLEEAYRRLVMKAKIPGFRKGKAPRAILERYVGKEGLLEDALNNLIPEAYEKAISEQALEAIARPQIEITQTEPVVFKAIVPLKPEVRLGDYQRIRVKPKLVAVTEGDVDAVMEQLRHQHATWEPAERPVAFGDLVVLDIESSIDGEPFINRQGIQYQVIQEQSVPAPGFAEQLSGMKKDEAKEFQLQFPSDHPGGELAGKEPRFKVTVNEIKMEILPELNDAFAGVVSPDFETLNSLRERAFTDLKSRAEDRARADFEERVLDAVVELSEVESPPILVEVEIDRMLNQRFQNGQQEMEAYLNRIKKEVAELREELRPLATTRVVRSLVLGKVVEEEKIEVSDAEIDTEIKNMMKSATENQAELEKVLNSLQARESIGQSLITGKAVQRLTEIANETKKTKTTQTKRKKEEK